jgi:hypothetical protein
MNGYFYSSKFASMKTEIEGNCPSYNSLRNVTVALSHKVDTFSSQMNETKTKHDDEVKILNSQKAQCEKKISEMKDKLDHCKQIADSFLNL